MRGNRESTTPRLIVLRGWDPNNPTNRTKRAPLGSGQQPVSGQVISLQYANGAASWTVGVVTADTDVPHFAYQDWNDFDVISSGVLTGLSSLDNITLQTAFFTASPTPTYTAGAPLKADTSTAGNVTTQALTGGTTPCAILGYVSPLTNGPVDLNVGGAQGQGINSSAALNGSGQLLVLEIDTAFQRNAVHT